MKIQTDEEIVAALCHVYDCQAQELVEKATRSLIMDKAFCDKPDDRLYHAADKTWWRRDKKGKLVAADPPLEDEEDDFWSAIGNRDTL